MSFNTEKEEIVISSDSDDEVQHINHSEEITVISEKNSSDKDNCSICLENFNDRSFLNDCFHAFCYYCILQWSELSTSCPLCKKTFRYIVHDVKSITDYKETHVKKDEPAQLPPSRRNAFRPIVRYRTTQQDGLISDNVNDQVSRVTSRKRGRQLQSKSEKIKSKRMKVYRDELYSVHPPTGDQKLRIASPRFFKKYEATKHRLAQWIKMDLNVLLYNQNDHVLFVMNLVYKLLDKYAIKSTEFAAKLEPYLHKSTTLFCHELYNFAVSPFSLETYLDKVEYRRKNNDAPIPISRWDESPVRYIGETGAPTSDTVPDTIARTRWDTTPSPGNVRPSPTASTSSVEFLDESCNTTPQLYEIKDMATPERGRGPIEIRDDDPCPNRSPTRVPVSLNLTPSPLSHASPPPSGSPPRRGKSWEEMNPQGFGEVGRGKTPEYHEGDDIPNTPSPEKTQEITTPPLLLKGKGKERKRRSSKENKEGTCDKKLKSVSKTIVKLNMDDSQPCSSKHWSEFL